MKKTVTEKETSKPRRAVKRSKIAVTPELSAKRRAASLSQWEGKERTPYATIRLSVRAIKLIREDSDRRGVSNSQAVIDALEAGDMTLSKI